MLDYDSLEDFLTRLMTHAAEYQTLQGLLTYQQKPAPQSLLRILLRRLPSYIASTHFYLQTVCKYPAKPHRYCVELEAMRAELSAFLQDLVQRLSAPAFRLQVNQQQSQMNRTYRAMCEYVDALFATHARLVVIRLDFSYQQEADVGLDQLERDLKRFYDSTAYVPLFNHMVGHILKIEYGLEKGLHVHGLLFFDGSKRKGSSDVYLAKQIGQHWSDTIVGAQGRYWNCHDDKAHYTRLGLLGIGDIHYSDATEIQNLKRIVEYLCKRGQFIKPIDTPKTRLVRKGNTPKKNPAGAPRKTPQCIVS
jgi:hypothetical protein